MLCTFKVCQKQPRYSRISRKLLWNFPDITMIRRSNGISQHLCHKIRKNMLTEKPEIMFRISTIKLSGIQSILFTVYVQVVGHVYN